MDELVSKLTEIRKAADKQLDKELNEVISCVTTDRHSKEAYELVNAALQLRSLPEGLRIINLREVLFTLDGFSTQYSALEDISNAENFSTVSSALVKLADAAVYDILDDGCLDLLRVECSEHLATTAFPTKDTKFVRYYLTSREWLTREEAEKRILNTNVGRITRIFEVKITGMKRMWFGKVEKFVEFLKILANKDNYVFPYNENMVSAIDKLMQPEKFKEWED